MNGDFRRELRALLALKDSNMSNLAFKMGVGQPYISAVVNNKKMLTRKTLLSIVESLTNDFDLQEDQVFRLAFLGCQRCVAERDLDTLCAVRPERVMAWINGESSYATQISDAQRTHIHNRIKKNAEHFKNAQGNE